MSGWFKGREGKQLESAEMSWRANFEVRLSMMDRVRIGFMLKINVSKKNKHVL